MASFPSSSSSPPLLLFLLLLSLSLFPFPSQSTNCTSQTFSNNRPFHSCSNLPHLNSSLYWTYHPSNSSLSIAFVAPPTKSNGWIAWAINPTATHMVGAQSLIAFLNSNGSIVVRTFNITSYGPISPSPISIPVSDLQAESSDGVFRIFATVEVPKNMTKINQVWQVGGSVTGGVPDKHDFGQENLNAFGELDLLNGGNGEQQKSNGTVPVSGGNQKSNGTVPTSGVNATSISSPSSSPSSFSTILAPSVVSFWTLFVGILTIFWSV
ncbi:cytochrome b561 and DOMON domain-containing protein [Cinnamomum micranthum f. kanehirae]|uniref:Cytochrome b561 and DOMON domain-containing protein n=1 Tax=Cinnamomum micranthum f. kanehirae TaxID=337451 RepID=A0A3S3N368_9MAGN|nr:cytochrome b561 and DOMON domain-containing protein [Cinnamomum micranthum f. kanehirae]